MPSSTISSALRLLAAAMLAFVLCAPAAASHLVTGNGFGFAVVAPESGTATKFYPHPHNYLRPDPSNALGEGIETANFIKALNDCTDTVYNVQFSCGDECTPGAMRCNGGASEQCGDYDGDACFEWGGAEACGADGSGDVCLDDGTCGEPGVCSNDCASGQKRCTGDWSDNCGQFDGDACLDWGNGEDCRNYGADFHCDPGSGACVYAPPACTDECSSVQKRCSGDWSENCGNYDTSDACLEWGGAEWCPNYGADYHCDPGSGACVNSPGCTDECGAGAKRCIGDWSDNCGYYDGDACLDWGNGEWCPNYGADFHCDPGSGYCVYAPPPPPPPACDCTVPAVQGCTGWACDEWGCWPVGGSQYCIANGGPNECGNWGCCWDGSSCI